MYKTQLRIAHMADMQYELRVSGDGGQRHNEYAAVNANTLRSLHKLQPDVVVIAGDVYQYESANGDETKMFGAFLRSVLQIPSVRRIVIIPGNHDVKQKHNAVIVDNTKTNVTDSIDSVVSNIGDSRVVYYRHTGVYFDEFLSLNWAVWSQVDKWSPAEPKPAYSPWVDNEHDTTIPLIELFHDPKRGAKGFDGLPSKEHADYKITLDDFHANTVLAGDIHAPDIVWFGDNKEKLFTYPSSLAIRNFGEGDYFQNARLLHLGNVKHGYNHVEWSLTHDKAISCEFIPIENPVCRTTIFIDALFHYSTAEMNVLVNSINQGAVNHVRIRCKGDVSKFNAAKEQLSEIFYATIPNLTLSFGYDAEAFELKIDDEMFTNLEQAVDIAKVIELSKGYVEKMIAKTTTIAKEDKHAAVEYLQSIVVKELNKLDFASKIQRIDVKSAGASNFMKLVDAALIFDSSLLNVIQGANGTGKTTIMHLLNWLFTDQISAYQSMRDKKYNNLMYFNTDSESDEVSGWSNFSIDGKRHRLEKTLTRVWKGDKDIKADDWMSNIKAVKRHVELRIQETSGDWIIHENEAAEEILKSIFDFNTMQKLTFINTHTANSLVNSGPEEIAQDFLSIMGLDIAQKLNDFYEDTKHVELSELSKPSESVEDLVAGVVAFETAIEAKDAELLLLREQIEEKSSEVARHEQAIAEYNEDIVPTLPIETINQLYAEERAQSDKIKSLDVELQTIQFSLSNTAESNLDELTRMSIDVNNDITHLTATISSNNLSIADTKTLIASQMSDAQVIAAEIVQQDAEIVQKHHDTISQHHSELSHINTMKQQIVAQRSHLLEAAQSKLNTAIAIERDGLNCVINEKSEIERTLNALQSKIALTEQTIRSNQQQIVRLQQSKTTNCVTCGTLPNNDAIISIDANISNYTRQVDSCNEQIQSIQSEIAATQQAAADKQTEIDRINALIADMTNRYHAIKDSAEYVNQCDEHQCGTIAEDALTTTENSINAKISELQSRIAEVQAATQQRVKDDPRIVAMQAERTTLHERISVLQQEIDASNQQIDVMRSELQEINSRIDLQKQTESQRARAQFIKEVMPAEKALHEKIQSQIDAENLKAETNRIVELQRNEYNLTFLQPAKRSLLELQGNFYTGTNLKSEQNVRLEQLRKDVENAKLYKLREASLKLYKKIIGKDGLPLFVFAHMIPIINAELSKTLPEVKFRLFFDSNTLELRFLDVEQQVTRPLTFISGMERTAAVMIVTQIRRKLNRHQLFNFIFIDEISGTLNSGKNLTYTANDYKTIMSTYIKNVSKEMPIYIIDHVLDFGTDVRVTEVVPVENGSTLLTLQKS